MSANPIPLFWTGGTVPVLHRLQPIESPSRAPLPVAHSRFVHVVEQGTVLRRAGGRLLVTREKEVLLEVPAVKLQGVFVYGNVQVSTQCMRKLLEEGIWLSFLTRQGNYKGRLQPPSERGGNLRRRQYDRTRDAAFSLEMARAMVRGKILSARKNAAAYSKNLAAESLGEGQRMLRESLDRLASVSGIEEMLGVEGSAARAYFGLFRRWNCSEFPFETREKRGATDPINVLLNFGYTMLTREWEGLLEAAGFDPAIGFYHQEHDGRPSLACDCVEEFRHDFVDRLVLRLVNQKRILPDHFVELPERGGLRLSPEGLRRFLSSYEKALVGTAEPEPGETSGFRAKFIAQLVRLHDAITAGTPFRSHLEE